LEFDVKEYHTSSLVAVIFKAVFAVDFVASVKSPLIGLEVNDGNKVIAPATSSFPGGAAKHTICTNKQKSKELKKRKLNMC
jgi:hypothetical protein